MNIKKILYQIYHIDELILLQKKMEKLIVLKLNFREFQKKQLNKSMNIQMAKI